MKLKMIQGNETKLAQTFVYSRKIVRPGLEFLGIIFKKTNSKLFCIGSKEIIYLSSLNEQEQQQALQNLIKAKCCCLIISKNSHLPTPFLEAAAAADLIILQSPLSYTDTFIALASFLNTIFAKTILRHGTLIQIYGKGVFITGKSGIGKSETALELIAKGHLFIADDGVAIKRLGVSLIGMCPEKIQNLLEVRGIGIIDIEKMFGASTIIKSSSIDCVIELKMINKNTHFERLGREIEYTTLHGLEKPIIKIPISPGRNIANLIETAILQLGLKQRGFNPLKDFTTKQKEE